LGKLGQQLGKRTFSLLLLARATERIHQLLDLRLYAFQKSLRLAAGRFHAASALEAVNLFSLGIGHAAFGQAFGIESDLNSHVAGRGICFEMDVCNLEPVAASRSGRREGRNDRNPNNADTHC